MEKTIFHVDVNSAFLSWSAVKRLEEEPGAEDLREIPSAVGGDQETRHRIILAKSLPAKKYGIQTAMTVSKALSLCPNLVLVKADFESYRDYSRKFIEILRETSDLVEQASIDEAYVDVTGSREIFRRLETAEVPWPLSLAHWLKDRIRAELGFTVNVGVSTNKLLAKMASDFEKPDRVHTLYPEEVPEKMWPLPIGELFGCGKATADRLRTLGILTIGDAAAIDPKILRSFLGEKSGTYISEAANGAGSNVVRPVREEAKSYSNETTLSEDLVENNFNTRSPSIIKELSEKVASRLRKDGVFGGTVVVSVKSSDFHRRSRQQPLVHPTNEASLIEETALRLLAPLAEELFAAGQGIRLLGVGVTNLDHGENRQLSIFDIQQAQDPRLAALQDAINSKYGPGTLRRGV